MSSAKRIRVVFLAAFFLFACHTSLSAQSGATHNATKVTSDGKAVRKEKVKVAVAPDKLEIIGVRSGSSVTSIPLSTIVEAEYTYSRKPSYRAGTVAVLAIGIQGWPMFFNSTKTNWLTINAGERSAVLQLESKNYRMLLLDLQNRGVAVIDRGDQDDIKKEEKEKAKKKKNSEKSGESGQ